MVLFQDPGDAALAGLAVDPDNGFIVAAEIARVDRQIGYVPIFVIALFLRRETFLDRVLMRTGESGEYQLASIRMARRNR